MNPLRQIMDNVDLIRTALTNNQPQQYSSRPFINPLNQIRDDVADITAAIVDSNNVNRRRFLPADEPSRMILDGMKTLLEQTYPDADYSDYFEFADTVVTPSTIDFGTVMDNRSILCWFTSSGMEMAPLQAFARVIDIQFAGVIIMGNGSISTIIGTWDYDTQWNVSLSD